MYSRLFDVYVSPVLLYRNSVWYLSLRKNKNSIERVSYKCKVELTSDVPNTDIFSRFDEADARHMRSLEKCPSKFDTMFNIVNTVTRAGRIITPKHAF